MEVVNISILGCVIIIFLLSYKKELKIKECIFFYITYFIIKVLLEYVIKDKIESIYSFILNIILNYSILKFIFKEKINVLDIFYIAYVIIIYTLINFIVKDKIYITLIFLMIALILLKNREKLIKVNHKVSMLWNRGDSKSLTLRNVFLIIFNLSIALVGTLLNKL